MRKTAEQIADEVLAKHANTASGSFEGAIVPTSTGALAGGLGGDMLMKYKINKEVPGALELARKGTSAKAKSLVKGLRRGARTRGGLLGAAGGLGAAGLYGFLKSHD